MQKKIFIFILFAVFCVNTIFASDAEEIINKVKNNYKSIDSFSASFTQQFKWKLVGEAQEHHGKLLLKGDDKFRIETDDQVIVSNGKTLWTFSKINNQVLIDNVEKAEEVVLPREIFLKFSRDYHPEYIKEEKISGMKCHVLNLITTTENQFIREMKIWVGQKDWITKKVEHKDINDNITTYILENIQVNKKISNDQFIFQLPENIEVIDMR